MNTKRYPYIPHTCASYGCNREALYGKRYCPRCEEEILGEPVHFAEFLGNAVNFLIVLAFCLVAGWIFYQWLYQGGAI